MREQTVVLLTKSPGPALTVSIDYRRNTVSLLTLSLSIVTRLSIT